MNTSSPFPFSKIYSPITNKCVLGCVKALIPFFDAYPYST